MFLDRVAIDLEAPPGAIFVLFDSVFVPYSTSSIVSGIGATKRSPNSVAARVAEADLSASLRRVADLVLQDPEAVAFGTVASVAARAAVSTPSVIRLAQAVGFSGFAEFRDVVRTELSARLNTAAVRVGRTSEEPLTTAMLRIEGGNIVKTLGRLDAAAAERAVALLGDPGRQVFVLGSAQTAGSAAYFAEHLRIARDSVTLLSGSEFQVMSQLAALRRGDVMITLDIERHERALVGEQRWAVTHGAIPIVITDRLPSRLITAGGVAMTFSCETAGPFESMVGLTVLTGYLVNAVCARHRSELAGRLRRLERIWTSTSQFDA